MRRMSGMDAAFLYGETPAWHMHISALLVCDPSSSPDGFSVERFKEIVASRLPQVPQFRWRYVEVPFGLDRPGWVEDPDFDIEYHIRRIGVPAPGGPEELGRLVGDLASYKLDRSRPLWEMWVIEGLADGNVAVLAKLHHSIVDGVSGAELATVLLDLQPDSAPAPIAVRDTLAHERVPNQLELLFRGIGHQLLFPLRFTRFGAQAVRQALTFAGFMRRSQPPAVPWQAPRTSLNAPISPHRVFAAASVAFDRVHDVKDAFGVKVNDVVLAVCAGALGRYLDDNDELPPTPLIAQVPVSLRSSEQRSDVGTKVGFMFASLATDVDDPVERVRAIAASTQSAKEMQRALSAQKIMGLTDVAAPGLISVAARMWTSAGLSATTLPLFNVIISNVPGPPFPLYVAGAEVKALYPMGPLVYDCALNVTVMSYRGSIDFGFIACREAVPEPERIAAAIEDALVELEKCAATMTAGAS
jgi:WS/DGAT/MGAT family acyltransferase